MEDLDNSAFGKLWADSETQAKEKVFRLFDARWEEDGNQTIEIPMLSSLYHAGNIAVAAHMADFPIFASLDMKEAMYYLNYGPNRKLSDLKTSRRCQLAVFRGQFHNGQNNTGFAEDLYDLGIRHDWHRCVAARHWAQAHGLDGWYRPDVGKEVLICKPIECVDFFGLV